METQEGGAASVIEIPVSQARREIARIIALITDEDAFVYLTLRGRRVAVIMPADIGENYERIEDEYWAARAGAARDRLASGEDELISYDRLVAETEDGGEEDASARQSRDETARGFSVLTAMGGGMRRSRDADAEAGQGGDGAS